MTDATIMTQLHARDETALAALEQAYGRLCRSIAQNVLGSAEDAEECVNDTWLRIWQSIPPARPSSLSAYAGMITRRLAINRYHAATAARRDARAVVTTPYDELAELIPADGEVGDRLEAEALAGAINAFLATLKTEDRLLFVRRYWYLDPPTALAAQLGVSENTLYVRLHRMRKRLRAYLEKQNLL
ncbi:MAG: sigma-70 family RNA polymerase sigma factor [Clostridia bacterium]|nr:sigma-70 family RNA polymerase sigma factor [Clostridia bacterium]